MAGMWDGVYTEHWTFWAPIIGLLAGLTILVVWRPLPWGLLSIVGATAVVTIGVVSLQWGVPYPKQDPWTHLAYARSQTILGINPYPALHILVITLSELLGGKVQHWLILMPVIGAAIGSVGLAALISRLPVSRTMAQPAYIALLPAIGQKFHPRPFTIAFATLLPICLLLFIIYLQRSPSSRGRVPASLLLCLFPLMTLWHPQLLWHMAIITCVGGIIVAVSKYNVAQRAFSGSSPAKKFSLIYMVFPWVFIVFYLFMIVPVGENIIEHTFFAYATSGSTDTIQSAAQGAGPFSLFSSMNAFFEAVSRLSYPLALSTAVGLAGLSQLWRQKFDVTYLSLTLSGAVMAVMFFAVFLLSSSLGLERFLSLLPLALLPGVPFALRKWPAIRAILLVCCLTAGIVGVYPSGLAGESGSSTTTSSPAQIEWVSQYGTGAEIAHGGVIRQLKAANPSSSIWRKYQSMPRSAQPWLIPPTDDSIYVIQASDVALLQQALAEGANPQFKDRYSHFTIQSNHIYSNGKDDVYQPA